MTAWAAIPAMPAALGSYAACTDSVGRIVITGGFRASAVQTDAVRFDPSANAWTQLANLPGGLAQHTQALDDQGDLYVYGGFNGSVSVGAVRRYNKTTGQWDSAPQQMNRPRAGLAGCSDQQGRLYALGGSGNSVNNTCERYTRSTDTWTFIAPLPGGARQGCRAVTDAQGRIYLIGGSANDTQSSRVERYNPSTNTWEALASLNTGRETPGVAIANGKVYVYGGYIFQNSSIVPTFTAEVYDPAANTWSYITGMSVARAEITGAGDIQGRMYAIGGYAPGANSYVASAERNTENSAPNVGGKPSPDGTSIDRSAATTFTYPFSDPDAGDQPSRTDWRWRTSPSSGTPGAWNTSTVTGTSTSITYPANTFAAGRIEVQDFPYDSQGVAAPGWSDSAFVTAADAPTAVTFVSPAAGSTIPSSTLTTTISTPQLDALGWEVRDTSSNALLASGTIEDSTARAFTVTGLANGTTVRARARRRVSGLWSAWADNGAQSVSFTPPPLPVLTITYDSTRGSATEGTMLISWAIPAPAGSEPTVTGIDISLDHGDLDGMHRVAAALPPGTGTAGALSGSWRYWSPAHARDYGSGSARVRLTAIGANGTTRTATS